MVINSNEFPKTTYLPKESNRLLNYGISWSSSVVCSREFRRNLRKKFQSIKKIRYLFLLQLCLLVGIAFFNKFLIRP